MVKSYLRVGERGTKTKVAPTCEFIEEKKSAQAEGASDVSVTHYSLWIMSIIKAKSAINTHSYGRYVRLTISDEQLINAKMSDVTPLRMRSGIYIK